MKKESISFITTIFLLILATASVRCKPDYSYEGGLSPEYNFIGAPDVCSTAIVAGTFTAGEATIDSVNTVTLGIHVVRPGSINVSTEELAGLSFTASKTFNDTCTACIIVLQSHAKPDSAGMYNFHLPGVSGCSFTVAVAHRPPAAYVFVGSPTDCSNSILNGSFSAGTPIVSENYITVSVNVTSPGEYNIVSTAKNGLKFSASGIFDRLGIQQVKLVAAGEPEIAEISRFTLQNTASNCNFLVPVNNALPVATYVLQSTIQNSITTCTPGFTEGIFKVGIPLTTKETLTVNAFVVEVGNYTISTALQNGFRFIHTGKFTKTGAQDVVLQGIGTPAAAGTYTFQPTIVGPAPLGGSSCGLDVAVK